MSSELLYVARRDAYAATRAAFNVIAVEGVGPVGEARGAFVVAAAEFLKSGR
ncbi:hypothetical protein [Streptomyces niveus]|uniref:hypothetical protein n=1 Tax=Streptomyces niveus TaxID=193462 RepID=UPI00378C398D|nr:hypothetical protein OG211_24215 [Streptomyces niveus]